MRTHHSASTLAAAAALSLVVSGIAAGAAAEAQEQIYTSTGDRGTMTVSSMPVTPGLDPEVAFGATAPPSALLGDVVIDEGFEDVPSLPDAGWVSINRSQPLGQGTWDQGNSNFFPAQEGTDNSYIASPVLVCCPDIGDSGTVSNWLLTPPLTLVNGTTVTFYTRTIADSVHPDRMELRYSVAGASTDVGPNAASVGVFDHLVATINPDLTPGVYPEAWLQITLTIVSLPEPVLGRVAFRHWVTDAGFPSPGGGSNGLYIGIDSVTATVPPPPDIVVEPTSLSATLQQGTLETQSLTVANQGEQPLEWELTDNLFRAEFFSTLVNSCSTVPAAVMDPQGEFAYFGCELRHGESSLFQAIELDTGEPAGRVFLPDESKVRSAVIDPQGTFAYLVIDTVPDRVVKIDLANFERVGAIDLEPDEFVLRSAVIDPQGEFAYFGTFTSPGRVVKINLTTFKREATLILPSGINALMSAVIDPAGQFAYFGAVVGDLAGVVKIDLIDFEFEDADTFVDTVTVGAPMSAAIDPAGDFIYFGMDDPAVWQVVKFDLGLFEEVAELHGLDASSISSAVMDPQGEYAYFGTATAPGKALKSE